MGVRQSTLRKWFGGGSALKRVEGPLLTSRGYFPIYVGTNEDTCRKFMVHTRVLGDADFCELLGRSAEEYGFRNDGVLRILFEAQEFEEWLVTKSNKKVIRTNNSVLNCGYGRGCDCAVFIAITENCGHNCGCGVQFETMKRK